MTTEELLQPRFKVIADFPGSNFGIGEILDKEWVGKFFDELQYFPHLFRKLEWFEDRKVEDLPEYLKDEFDSFTNYYKVIKYYLNSETVDLYDTKIGSTFNEFINVFKPATKEEYETNNNI